MQIKLSEVVEAIDNTETDRQYYYYIPEERIIIPDDDSIKEKQLIPLPTHKQIDDYGTMRDFIESLDESKEKEWLAEAIRGAGAFRRFRSTLERFGISDKWYDFLEQAHENIAIDWCEYYGIEYLDDDSFAPVKTEEAKAEPKIIDRHNYRFITIDKDNVYSLAYLTVDFRKTLAKLRNNELNYDVDDAVEELRHYLNKGYPVFAVSDNGRYIGYAVCRIDDDVVWLEQIYVRKEYRRKGVGRMLFERAEAIAKEYGNDTLYQYIHPNNDIMASFLKANGYDVLNLIEIRKGAPEEDNEKSYLIGDNEYRY
ncbi:MAG: GNAT family N-acetyltransferase [Erysipelotrichaceae bacterium]|nr:GNAT family N-acetyltransferase [Erysipelotrichaceae bacterium]